MVLVDVTTLIFCADVLPFSIGYQVSFLLDNCQFSQNGAGSINIDQLSDAGLLDGETLANVLNDPTLVSGTGGAVSLNLINDARYSSQELSHWKMP